MLILLCFSLLATTSFYWHANKAKTPLPCLNEPIIFYSDHLGHNLQKVILDFLSHATQRVCLASYGFTDAKIAKKLSSLAQEGIEVDLFLDAKNIRQKDLKLLDPKIRIHKIRCRGLMHRKWITIDDKWTLLGTANLTRASLLMHHNFMVGVLSPEMTAAFKDPLLDAQKLSFKIGQQNLELYLLPDKKKLCLSKICSIFENSPKDVKVALFTFTHSELKESILRSAKLGAKVAIYIDSQSGQGASCKTAQSLLKGGIDPRMSFGLPLFHHKLAQIDQTLVIGSANWTKAAFDKNLDDVLLIDPLTPAQQKTLSIFWDSLHKTTLPSSSLQPPLQEREVA